MKEATEKPVIEEMPSAKVLLWSRAIHGRECEIVTDFGKQLEELVDVLRFTMYDHKGVGLAAPQIGVFKKVAVIQIVEDRTRPPFVMVNPVIVNTAGTSTEWEGCLSLPGNGTRQRVERPHFAKVVFQDITGKQETLEMSGMMARAVQHECDHLEGRFFIDHLSRLKRDIVLRNYRKCSHGTNAYLSEPEASGMFVLAPTAPKKKHKTSLEDMAVGLRK